MARRGRPPLGPAIDGQAATRLTEEQELTLAARVAEAYYLDHSPMVQIAERHSITRFQVARLLQLARQSGIVTIEIHRPGVVDEELSAAVRSELGLTKAIVLSGASAAPRHEVGMALADVVSGAVQSGDIVGLTWSRTLVETTRNLKHLEPCTLVQLAGHLTDEVTSPGSVEAIRRAAEISGGTAYPIYAPLLAPDGYVAHALSQQPDVAMAFDFYDRLTLAVISIGSWGEGMSSIYDAASEQERARGVAAGVVGEISGRLFDATGTLVPQVLDERVIAITLPQLARVPHVIASSYGAQRASATRAAAAAGLFQTLILDRSLALAVLDGPAPH
ncbi:sugar-binding transcriptional regulator [Amnibacterium flavum]|nr:sugar-binding domain-containing protein [Amnibacterium flavum]